MQEMLVIPWVGTMLGILAGAIGTYVSFASPKTMLMRSLAIKSSLIAWFFAGGFIAAFLYLAPEFRIFLWFPYFICLPLGLYRIDKARREALVRQKLSIPRR